MHDIPPTTPTVGDQVTDLLQSLPGAGPYSTMPGWTRLGDEGFIERIEAVGRCLIVLPPTASHEGADTHVNLAVSKVNVHGHAEDVPAPTVQRWTDGGYEDAPLVAVQWGVTTMFMDDDQALLLAAAILRACGVDEMTVAEDVAS
jgi:hypothetical protein